MKKKEIINNIIGNKIIKIEEKSYLSNKNKIFIHKNIKNRKSKLIFIFLIIIVLFRFKNFFLFTEIIDNINKLLEKIIIKNGSDSQNIFKDILPKKDRKKNEFLSLEEIFNSRELFITDANLTEKYIRYIRPITNEKEKERYKRNNSENQIIFNSDYFKKRRRKDQYDYKEFLKICVENKLIDSNKIEYNNKPIISIILISYNKYNDLMISIRSIQNQNFKNIEIIIVDDCSTDNSTKIFKYLLETDPRIRIFTHLKNMGIWRSRLDGFLYSRAKYILHFDTSDLYEDNYVLEDFYNLIEKNNLDSVKMIFRRIYNYHNGKKTRIHFHVYNRSKIVYETPNIMAINRKVFGASRNVWNRITKANIFSKGLYLLNERVLNIYKNLWEDIWDNDIIDRASYNFLIVERIGYMYYRHHNSYGDVKLGTEIQRDDMIQEYINFLVYDYFILPKNNNKAKIIKKLHIYNRNDTKLKLDNFKSKFYILNDLLNLLIKDPYVSIKEKPFLNKLLNDSIIRENNITKRK